jgi:hypothetical protein
MIGVPVVVVEGWSRTQEVGYGMVCPTERELGRTSRMGTTIGIGTTTRIGKPTGIGMVWVLF